MSERVNLGKELPHIYQSVLEVDRLAEAAALEAGWTAGFTHLVKLRASQINQCAFCLRMHARDALAAGEAPDRLAVLPAWRETAYFTSKERAGLALTEVITLVASDQIPDAVYAEAAKALNTREIASIEWLAVVINMWNRVAISCRTPVHP
ncbi:carboxymuconolactone decarboxylase family protein [Comamonas resistens]|uniref:Carboxymuconolactone decarboxylase family protein n=1 Tax=Comamonas resistens TaxID=3046670 RepID=A0ABY8SSV3_9BURK|nr:carboxymuconolactone decarboxylase family protein [Comamonas resistens]MDL5036034.1 carboxymuconolactone decarboxylase family protein [Comamonas resistens]WHS66132.1 carboxymuconolactone decarboxylase family protein [Comamonas resistens]